ncbi:MAG: protein translocase subunit SecD [Candidatus Zambryskibacteria bacterium CG_4_9_14_3_um_filter_42_9]|nr:MAG: protein translocase subunit SecD [Candidatus Zambryskibacteria bacterium CG_4_9_14_3_um_filter_42_9]
MNKSIWLSLLFVVAIALLAFFVVKSEREGSRFPFQFGLDLVGGTELVYTADTSGVDDPQDAMESLKEVMERRVNIFGVSEPMIQTERAGLITGNQEDRLIIGLPGVTDLEKAIELIGETPILEFRLANPDAEAILEENPDASVDELFISTGLTGRYLSRARVEFDHNTGSPLVALEFDSEGADLFAEITRENKGEILAIILDSTVISAPVIIDEISDGNAQITGTFSATEVREVVRNLNYGALPVPIELATSATVGATLGEEVLSAGVRAGIIGLILLSVFMIAWYRVPGLVASIALIFYILVLLALFKLIPVTLTAAGIAGFILSLGMAVDANILIFERAKEELKKGKDVKTAIEEGFARAWPAIRDSNISSIITAVILFWLGTAGVKGFALTFGLGVGISMLSAIVVTRTFLLSLMFSKESPFKRKLFGNGIS